MAAEAAPDVVPAAAPSVVRIKRKRDEPPLTGFILGNKRAHTSFSGLSLDRDGADAASAAEATPPARGTRYRLVSVSGTPWSRGVDGAGSHDAASLAAMREVDVRRQQTAARFRRVALGRGASSGSHECGTAPGVLELQRLAVPSSPQPAPKLRPFGPPLPRRTAAPVPTEPAATEAEVGLDALWADAAAAAELAAEEAATATGEDEGAYVYDEYEPTTAEDGAPEGEECGAPAMIWWEDLDDESLLGEGADALADGEGSDSQGEVDYPDEESDASADSDDGGTRYWR